MIKCFLVRYEDLWMPLIADLTVGQNHRPPMILPPFDIEWIWYCHTLKPVTKKHFTPVKSRFLELLFIIMF